MKKFLIAILFICFLLPSNFCTAESDTFNREIPYRVFVRGFTAFSQEDQTAYQALSEISGYHWIINNQEAFNNFQANYCSGIPGYEPYDFSKDIILATVLFGAKPTYCTASDILRVCTQDNYIYPEFSNDPADYIYAINNSGIGHFFVTLLIITRSDLPANLENPVYPGFLDQLEAEVSDTERLEALANTFANAYFAGKADVIAGMLTEPYPYPRDLFYAGQTSSFRLKGLERVADEEEIGSRRTIEAEFVNPQTQDSFLYLCMEFIKESDNPDGWKVQFFGIDA